jgi:hypothetical protein
LTKQCNYKIVILSFVLLPSPHHSHFLSSMNYFGAPALLFLLLAFVASYVQAALSPVSRIGKYLYTDGGSTRFYVKGIAYQNQGQVVTSADNPFEDPSTFTDPLADASGCNRDITYLKQLTVNVVRVYSVNSSLNHDTCMNLLSNAGIYTIIDLSLPLNGSINPNSPSWSTNLLDEYIATINAFEKYDNVLAYNVGNEVINASTTTNVTPYVKAAARDTKAYLQSINSTALVGYAAIDGDPDFVLPLAEFLSCDPSNSNSNSTSIDLYGLNNYEWCGDSTFEASYAGITADFSQYNVVAYFSEFGCITSPPRLWTEVVALFSTEMNAVWSGGVAFSYFPALSPQGQFGMVTISADGSTVTPGADFNTLQKQYSAVDFINSPAQSSVGPATYPSCPAANSTFNASDTLPPTPNDAACKCLENHLSCQFTPQTPNVTAIVGVLLNQACSFLGGQGGSCSDISSDGSTGVYGLVSGCSPSTELSYAMSKYYEITNRNPQSCNFAGNATVNPSASASVSASAVASSCFANAAAVFTPSSPASSGSSPTSTSKTGNSSVGLFGNLDAIFGMGMMAIIAVMSAVWTLV